MRKNLWAALLLALCLTGLTGCDAISVMERQTYALCFAVDAAEDGGLTLSVQTPVNGSGDDTSATPEYSVFTATGATFEDAMAVLTATTPCTVNFCQLKLCVFGYELASRERLQPLLHKITTISTMRPNAMVAVALGRGEEVLHAIKPDFGMRLSTYLDIFMDRLEKAKLTPRHTVTCLLRDLDTEMMDPIIAVCAVNPALQEEAQPQEGDEEQQTQESQTVFARGNIEDEAFSVPGTLAGRMPRTGSNPVEYTGSAAIGEDRVSGLLDAETTQTVLRLAKAARLEVGWDGERTQLRVCLGRRTRMDGALSDERIQKAVETLQGFHCDALGFGGASARCFAYNEEWEKWDIRQRYPTAEILIMRSE